jgi:predicted alpha/beta superfamily hydrolase
MKRICFLLFLSLLSISLFSQSNDIIIGKVDTIYSEILNEQRKVWIHIPKGGDGKTFARKKYPVMYVLDGSGHFYSTVGMIHQLSKVNGNTISPEMIVVGITNTHRTRDLTPSQPQAGDDAMLPEAMRAHSGGGEKFISFIEKELIPYIDSTYPTEPYKTFMGHSLGGLMVMYTFLNKPELFNAYVAIDPSMFWHNQKLLNEIKEANMGEGYENKTLFLGFANSLPSGMNIETVRNDTSPMSAHMRAILELDEYLNEQKGKFAYQGKYYPDDDHGSVPFISGYDALRFIFSFHRLDLGPEDFMNPEVDLAGKIKNHYKQVSQSLGYEKKPAEEFINMIGYQFLQMKSFDRSERIFKLNVSYYPDQFNVYDSLGDLYQAKGEKEKAIECFKKAVSLNGEADQTKDKIAKLEKE